MNFIKKFDKNCLTKVIQLSVTIVALILFVEIMDKEL